MARCIGLLVKKELVNIWSFSILVVFNRSFNCLECFISKLLLLKLVSDLLETLDKL